MFDHCLYFNTAALARRLDKEWSIVFRPFDLTVPQAFMLRALLERPGILPSELAQKMVISRPTVTRALDGLQAKGLVVRSSLKQDGRELQVHPTELAISMKEDLNFAAASVTSGLKRVLGAVAFAETVSRVKGVRSALE